MLPVIRALALRYLETNKRSIERQMSDTLMMLKGAVTQASITGQNRALLRFDWDTPRAKLWEELRGRTEAREQPLILGDSGCLFRLRGDPELRPYPEDPKDVVTVCLPLSKHLLLMGSGSESETAVDSARLNVASAQCSRSFYVSALGPEVHGMHQSQIGSRAIFFFREQIAEIARKCFADLGKPDRGG